MQIAIIIKHGYVNEVVVPDSSVKVVVVDADDPMGMATVTIEGREACIDSAAMAKHTADPARLAALVHQFKSGLLELEQTDQVRTVLALLDTETAAA